MNSGQRGKALSARDLTAEIDRATDVSAGLSESQVETEVPNGFVGNVEITRPPEMSNERARGLGRGALFGGNEAGVLMNGENETPEMVAFGQVDNTGEASVEGAVELSEVINNVTNPEAGVGVASEIEEKEYAQRDEETAENEANPRRSRGAEIEYKSQEAVAKGIVPGVNAFLSEKKPELSGLLDLYRMGRDRTLEIMNHPIGKDN